MTNYNSQESHPQVRLRNRLLAAAVLLLTVVNGVAGYFDLHGALAILILNGVGVLTFVVAIVLEFVRMIPRKRWRALSFLMPAIGVIVLFCGSVMNDEGSLQWSRACVAVGILIIGYGAICALKWRRYSLERKEQLHQARHRAAGK